jgi:hypothetical protein
MLDDATVQNLQRHWDEGWNAGDLATIMAPFAADVVFSSPFVPKLTGDPAKTTIDGDEALRSYVEYACAAPRGSGTRSTRRTPAPTRSSSSTPAISRTGPSGAGQILCASTRRARWWSGGATTLVTQSLLPPGRSVPNERSSRRHDREQFGVTWRRSRSSSGVRVKARSRHGRPWRGPGPRLYGSDGPLLSLGR